MLNTITISQLTQTGFKESICYRDKLVITDRLAYLKLFKYPCRLDALSIFICIDGEMDCSINLQRYHISKNTIVIITSNDIVQIHKADNLKAYAGLVSTDFISEMKINVWQNNYFSAVVNRCISYSITDSDFEDLRYFYPMLKKNIENNYKESGEIIKCLLQAFIYTVMSIINKTNVYNDKNAKRSRGEIIFEKFMYLLGQNHANQRTVAYYASEMCLTPNYLSGVLKEHTGKTALEWINEFVTLEAKIQLKYSVNSIQEIAYNLNFPNQSAFGKFFKQQTGIGPKAYRSLESEG